MDQNKSTHSMDDVLRYIDHIAGPTQHASKAMFYFLYKEILVNRTFILETARPENKAALEHNDKVINDLNRLLMEQLEKKK